MSEDIKIEIGKRIREERERQGLTREHVWDVYKRQVFLLTFKKSW